MYAEDTTIFDMIDYNDDYNSDDPKSIPNGVHIPFQRGDSIVMHPFGC